LLWSPSSSLRKDVGWLDCERAISSSFANSSSFAADFLDVGVSFFRRDFLVGLLFFCSWREGNGVFSITLVVCTGGGETGIEWLISIKSPWSSSSSSSVWLTTGFYKKIKIDHKRKEIIFEKLTDTFFTGLRGISPSISRKSK
jgi:hypothetical protein